MATINPVGSWTGLVQSVTISSTAVLLSSPAITYALSISAASGDPLAVDLDADALGNIKSLKVDAVVQNSTGGVLPPVSSLLLEFPNNPPAQETNGSFAVVPNETAQVKVVLVQ